MTGAQIVLVVYAFLLLLGGLLGARAGSRVSLIAGAASGAVLLLALVVSLVRPAAGLWLGTAVGLVLCIVFAARLAKTRKFMPSGLLLTIGVVAALVLLFAALGAS